MSSISQFETRSRRPQGDSRSQVGNASRRSIEGNEQGNYAGMWEQQPQHYPQYHPPLNHHSSYNYQSSQQPPPQIYQPQSSSYAQYQPHAQGAPSNAHPYSMRQPPAHHPQQLTNPRTSADINEVKSKILQARARNLALKRVIVQRNLQQGGKDTAVRSLSASSSRGVVAAKSSDDSNLPLSDAISDLESQLEKLKNSQNSQNQSITAQKDENEEAVVPKTHNVKDEEIFPPEKTNRKEQRRMSRRQSTSSDEKHQRPEVPLLPLGKKENISNEEEDIIEPKVHPKKKAKAKKKKMKPNTDREDRAAEALTKALDQMMGEVNSEIETNQGVLGEEKKIVSSRVEGGLNAPLDSYRVKELRRNEERKKRAEARIKIDSLLNNENLEFKIPRWKHIQNGNMDPKPEQILKGKSLFRMAAYLVLYFYAKPMVRVRVMRIMGRDMLKEDLTKATLLSLDTCASWLTSAIKIPLISIMQDLTLNFSALQNKDVKLRKDNHQQANLQMKVRITAMVKGITSIGVKDVPPHIKSFLERLITDGNFFRTDFLYGFERALLEFDQLGATNNVTKSLSDQEIEDVKAQATNSENGTAADEENDIIVVGEYTYLIRKAKMLIANFLILRVLITNGLLSPWDHGVGQKPLPKQKKIIDNLRMASSIFYAMLNIYQPTMAHIVVGSRRQTIQRMKSGRFKNYGVNRGTILAPDGPHPVIARVNTRPIDKDAIGDIDGENTQDETNDNDEENNTKSESDGDKKKYELPSWLSSFADKVLGEAQALNPVIDDATSFLLQSRPPFDNNLEHLHVFLFGYDQELGHVKHLIDPWMKELAKKLNTWLDELTRDTVSALKIKYQQEHNI
eukprot:CAMPEP_0114453712 /NCGR_PEP_ID=MMETSP0104-20121206/2192_1 /TAXON_ID=37642 ORGANISM="Paraphysomonas imperforata, Strain PA2" /NCGR_SAMPLE_ID=MMETSP0104 /ASSEMBLY_ACC=CAM_ASM_000202 /LENGTH=849 /DNA_ID=CAMNT_0001626043 /DNA_START=129 /DNA_END=2678 /DNA_ORIENTATION=-